MPQPETQASSLTPAQCSGHCNLSILLHSFCLPPDIQVSYLINPMSLFLGPPPPASSLVSLQSILYSAIRVAFQIILLSCLILQRLPIAHRIRAKSPSAGFSPGPCSLCGNLPPPTPCSYPLRRDTGLLYTHTSPHILVLANFYVSFKTQLRNPFLSTAAQPQSGEKPSLMSFQSTL